ncbi:MAG TPA: pilus assembly protein TadG-related protein [Roseiflexaceae bacterium]|nr:pilus assembly protein TadG-related protein [Roseiflexaceae bacterium]
MGTLRALPRDERGGLGYNTLWVCFALIFLIPFFWDVASVHYARRFAGTGADAASLAAAQEYARQLQHTPMHNGIFLGSCPRKEYTPQLVVLRYLTDPAFLAPPWLGYGYADNYARENRTDLLSYRSWPEHGGRQVAGVPIPWIKVAVDTRRKVFTAYEPIYGREFQAPNQALAVAFLDQWTMTPRPCVEDGVVVAFTYDFTFEWEVTLDTAR